MSIITKNTTKIVAGLVGIALALTVIVGVGAQTTNAQGMSICQLVDLFVGLGIIAPEKAAAARSSAGCSGTGSTMSAGYHFTAHLQVGSRGADVMSLQKVLNSNASTMVASSGVGSLGHESSYFGNLTKAALIKYQIWAQIPATGMVDDATLAKLNGSTTTTTTTTTTTGGTTTTTTGGTTTTTTGSTGTISTPGVEGIMTVTQGPLSTSVLNVGQQKAPVLTLRVQAQNSDISVQRIQLNLGTDTTIYNKIYNKLYVTDGTNVLASVPLNSSTVVQSGTNYIANITGINYVIPKGTYKDLVIKADLNSSIDSTYTTGKSYTISVLSNGVRGTDGAGIDQYDPGSTISQVITINKSLVDNAQVNVALDPSTPLTNAVAVTDTTNNQYLGLPVLIFDLYSQNDTNHLKNVTVRFTATQSASAGTISAAYLYQGSTPIMSAAVTAVAGSANSFIATFNNILDGQIVAPVNTNTPLTVKVDIAGVTAGALTVTASTSAADITAQNSQNQSLSAGNTTGSAQGNAITVSGLGPQFTLNTPPVLTSVVSNTDTNGNATTTYQATFNIHVVAVGTDVNLGLVSSTSPAQSGAFATTSNTYFAIYKNGATDALTNYSVGGITVNYTQPVNTSLSADKNTFTISRGNSADIPVTYSFAVKNPGSNQYQGQLEGINWFAATAAGPSTFMKDQPNWRTNSK